MHFIFLLVFVVVGKCFVDGFEVVSTTGRSEVNTNIFLENQLRTCLELNRENQRLREAENASNQKVLDKLQVLETHGMQLQHVKKQIADLRENIDQQMCVPDSILTGNITRLEKALKQHFVKSERNNAELKQLLRSVPRSENLLNLKKEIEEVVDTRLKNIVKSLPRLPRNCKDVQDQGYNFSGIYNIQPALAVEAFQVVCDMKTQEGGWTQILSRFDGSQDFFLEWKDYKRGFGNLDGEFWIGLEHLYQLLRDGHSELLFELVDLEKKQLYARYDNFEIGNEQEGYAIKTLGVYKGDAGNSFKFHHGMKFSTKDKDQDTCPKASCATDWRGAWWYACCSRCSLTAQYNPGKKPGGTSGMYWNGFHGRDYGLKQARMMIRQRNDGKEVLLPYETAA